MSRLHKQPKTLAEGIKFLQALKGKRIDAISIQVWVKEKKHGTSKRRGEDK